eukprot:augustus_masked-scaffold_3-processed-gene-14.12-mRNA-1 protein AED:0.00 eAED:0.00 QI:51/1/1/1/0/0.5/2/645/596
MENLQANKDVIPSELYDLCERACAEYDQKHLFESWNSPGTDDEGKVRLAKQLAELDKHYPGGIGKYVTNAKKLLKESKEGVNPFADMEPSIPEGEKLDLSSETGVTEFMKFEALGMDVVQNTCFVIVAGGLGERLGYSKIKLSLITNLLNEDTYLKHYADYILAYQERTNAEIPLAIMTSGDTHEGTVEILEANNYFNLKKEQVTLVKQEKVPALLDNDAKFAQAKDDPYEIQTKPHGHGDVHSLLYHSGLVGKWLEVGKSHICFLQDTNAAVFRAIPAALGVSAHNEFAMNSLSVSRKPGEPAGAICKLTKKDGTALTINVEYNQLEALLGSDSADSSGYSPYPGNVNILTLNLKSYAKALEETGGSVPEFVNPKYKDASKTTFKKPARLECMMQDFPRLFGQQDKVGFTQLPRWVCFSAVKNNLDEAKAKFASTGESGSASMGESDLYAASRRLLGLAGVSFPAEAEVEVKDFAGLPVKLGAKVILKPGFGVTIDELKKKFLTPEKVSISSTSSLILDGDIEIHSLHLDGHLEVTAEPGSKVVIKSLTVKNEGVLFDPVGPEAAEILRIRGYKLDRKAEGKKIAASSGTLTVEE